MASLTTTTPARSITRAGLWAFSIIMTGVSGMSSRSRIGSVRYIEVSALSRLVARSIGSRSGMTPTACSIGAICSTALAGSSANSRAMASISHSPLVGVEGGFRPGTR